ncbi:leucine-responsive regulatory protein [Lrp] [Thermoplasma volcanium GSS1]|uniref:Leucine-responsive regulatory protein [Lrp] n=1 Tax=Thermoplasma volcanium (strain ATCC 51530 / DSM 4299 / JCM 9571 / NBRC 15438 / GSS1) TaxID=273116 RepID=Q97BS4_THEVO|nr:Lrp/AsnC family transcriptional regulator [Thermoplasma volcanium]BAB59523.1 leucine-responsive regulatory protein [Lrp] [Thermoplasma volcanium GSS1]
MHPEKRNLSNLESRVLRELIDDSRSSVEEISERTGIGRNTVSKIIKDLERNGIIKKYTIKTSYEESEKKIIALTPDDVHIPDDLIYYNFKLSNGKRILVLSKSALDYDFQYDQVWISDTVEEGKAILSNITLYCDYCGNQIHGDPISVKWKNRTYLVCCPNCEKDMLKRLEKDNS